MLTIVSLGGIACLGYFLATCVLEIDDLNLYEMLILMLIGIGVLYRLIDRWPAGLARYQKYQGEKTQRRVLLGEAYKRSKINAPIKRWIREQRMQFLDYYDIWQAVHEWKRERIARSLIETVGIPEHSDSRSNEEEKNADAKRQRLSRNAYQTAERLLNEGKYLQGQEMTERVIWKEECPVCKGRGKDEKGGICGLCTRYWGSGVPRFDTNEEV